MTEEEWLTYVEPHGMIDHVRRTASLRKLQLFTCAFERSDRLDAPFAELVDQYVEGLIPEAVFLASLPPPRWDEPPWSWNQVLAQLPQRDGGADAVLKATQDKLDYHVAFYLKIPNTDEYWLDAVAKAREIFGNPFRPITVNPEWSTPTVLLVAQGIYDSRDFSAMPILADALQDAGCDSDDILNHFRDPNATHVRGCWALDLVLGKT
jgi:hypothetical protein